MSLLKKAHLLVLSLSILGSTQGEAFFFKSSPKTPEVKEAVVKKMEKTASILPQPHFEPNGSELVVVSKSHPLIPLSFLRNNPTVFPSLEIQDRPFVLIQTNFMELFDKQSLVVNINQIDFKTFPLCRTIQCAKKTPKVCTQLTAYQKKQLRDKITQASISLNLIQPRTKHHTLTYPTSCSFNLKQSSFTHPSVHLTPEYKNEITPLLVFSMYPLSPLFPNESTDFQNMVYPKSVKPNLDLAYFLVNSPYSNTLSSPPTTYLAINTLTDKMDLFSKFHNSPRTAYNIECKETIFPHSRLIDSAHIINLVPRPLLKGRAHYDVLQGNEVKTSLETVDSFKESEQLAKTMPIRLPSVKTKYTPTKDKKIVNIALFGNQRPESGFFQASEALQINRTHRLTQFDLLKFPTLESLGTESLGDEFTSALRVIPNMAKEGFVFSVQLSPQNAACLEPLPHRIYYILDRSSSIEKQHFETLKKAISQSLHYIDQDAYFNVIFIDQEVQAITPNDLKPTNSSIQFVQRTLQKVDRSRSTNFSTLLEALTNLQNEASTSQEVFTVILLSNGHLLKNIRIHREGFHAFASNLPNNFSLFTVAAGDQNNLEMLDFFARLGRGNLFYSNTQASFPRKLSVLMKRLKRPLATHLYLTNTEMNKSKANLLDLEYFAPILYAEKPYTIYATCKTLTSAEFILQGLAREHWINIRKTVSLKDAIQGNELIEKELSKQMALQEQLHFLLTNDPSHLLEAQRILSPFDPRLLYR